MLRIYYGPKGAGKSKRIISECNDHVQRAHGTIVYIDDDKSRSSEVLHRVRFIDSSDYDVKNDQFLLGFISGIVAQDHDLEAIYLDGFDSMVSTPLDDLKPFIEILEKIIQDNNIDFYLSINSETLPEYLQPCGVELK